MNQLLTVNDVAKILSVSVRTVYGHAERLDDFYPLSGYAARNEHSAKLGIKTNLC